MAAGRLIFGLGAESMIVAITVAIGQWFVGRQLGFAFGVNLSIARAGPYSADMSTTWFKPPYDLGWQPPLMLAAGIAGISVAACVAHLPLEQRASRRFDLGQPAPADRIVWSDLWRFDLSQLVYRRPVRDLLFGDLSVSEHVRDQVLPARPRPVAAERRADDRQSPGERAERHERRGA